MRRLAVVCALPVLAAAASPLHATPSLVAAPRAMAVATLVVPSQVPAAPTPAAVRERLAAVEPLLERYRADGDVRTNLFFRGFDRPYERATLACALKAVDVVRAALPRLERGELTPAERQRLSGILAWIDGAMARLRTATPRREFFPDRVRLDIPRAPAADTTASNAGPAVVTGWIAYRRLPGDAAARAGDDVDWAACLGAKLFLDARSGVPADATGPLTTRAAYLNVAYRRASGGLGDGVEPWAREFDVSDLFAADAPSLGDKGVLWSGMLPGDFGTQWWASRAAATALGPRRAVAGPLPMPLREDDAVAIERWRLALWSHALAGARVFVFTLDADDRDPGWSRPWFVEATAHTALDFLRLSDVLASFAGPAEVAVVGWVGADADVSGAASEADVSMYVGAVCESLADVQVAADLIGPRALVDAGPNARYRALVLAGVGPMPSPVAAAVKRLRDGGCILLDARPRPSAGGASTQPAPEPFQADLHAEPPDLSPIGEYLRRLREHGTILAQQIVPRAAGGAALPGVRAGSATDDRGRPLVYLVNTNDGPASFVLSRGGKAITGTATERISNQSIRPGAEPIVLPARAVWLLQLGS